MTVEQGGFAGTFTQAVKTVVVQPEQRMYTGICRIAFDRITVGILAFVVVFCPHPADHHLHRPDEIVHADDVVLHTVAGISNIAEVTPVKREVAANAVVPPDT
jgi:hypothetical protein